MIIMGGPFYYMGGHVTWAAQSFIRFYAWI